MKRKVTPVLAIVAIAAAPLAFAETTKPFSVTGTLAQPIEVEAAVGTVLKFFPPDADKEGEDKVKPFPFVGDWSFTWNGDKVDFTGEIIFGTHFTVTDAGTMGGTTRQSFVNYTHHVKGTASWDEATRTLTYDLAPKERDDEQASNVTEDKPAECDKIKGFTAGKACKAFLATSPGLEGLKLNMTFSEELSSLEGSAVLTQFGGSGMTKSQTDMKATISGAAQ